MNQLLLETNLNNYINDFSFNENSFNTSTTTNSNTTSTLCTLNNLSKNDQTSHLINKIKYLEEELSNAQADKEFVWSLWKQLQSSSPDVTNAIGQVVQREKEKAEIKDRKVLEILKIKDRKLDENDKIITELHSEITNLQNRVKTLDIETVSKNEEIDLLKKNVKTNEDKEQMYEQIIRLRDDKMEKIVKENEQEKIYLLNKVRDLTDESESLKLEIGRKASELQVRSLELKTVNENYEKLLNELNHFRESIDQSLKQENDKLRYELNKRTEHLEKLKVDSEELACKLNSNLECLNQQDKLIKQLKQIQNDQQNTIQTQKTTYEVLDSENLTLKKMYDDLLGKFEAFAHQDKSSHLLNEIEKLESKEKINRDLIKTRNNEIQKLKIESDMYKEKLGYTESIINELNRKCQILEEENGWKKKEEKCENKNSFKKSCQKTLKRSKSQNSRNNFEKDSSHYSDNETNRETNDEIKKYYENVIQVKEKELITLKNAHQRRFDKLMSLQKENDLLKKQLELNSNDDEMEKSDKKQNSKTNGYKRADTQLITKELNNLRHENEELEKENFRLKETNDELKFKVEEQNEKLQALNFELNFHLKDREKNLSNKHEILEKNLTEKREKCLKLESEITNLKHICKDLDAKCINITQDREKYFNLSNKFMNENKRLYKKWFDLRKKENKFRLILSQQIRKYAQYTKKQQNETSERNAVKKISPKTDEKTIAIQLKTKGLKLQQLKKQNDELLRQKTSLELKIQNFKGFNEKLNKDIENLDSKLKSSKLQIESLNNEILNFKKRESECKDLESINLKKEQEIREDLKKQSENKIRQLNNDLNRQITQNKSLKNENDKLADRIKVNEEKLNHLERDNNQKKQLVEFYKKKLEDSQIKSDPIVSYANDQILNELKSQVKKLSDLVEKYKSENKNLRTNLQTVQNEGQSLKEKAEKSEKTIASFKDKISVLKKKKQEIESELSEEHKRVLNLESLVNELESTAQNKLKSLSIASHETLNMAQLKVKYAFKLVENFECLIKNLYESLLNRLSSNRKMIEMEKGRKKESKLGEEMKFALDLASSVLNMSHTELDDLMHLKENKIENCEKLIFEFEQCLNTSKKEFQDLSDDFNVVNIDKVCELINRRLDELLSLEKELASLKKF